MEFKTFESKVVDVNDDERTITGISSVMGVVDAGGDLMFKGAFAKTIGENGTRVKHLWQHDFSMPPIAAVLDLKEIGRTDLPKDLKEKYPTAKGGLLVKRRYLDTPRGNEVLAGLKSSPAAINEMSFGYDAVKFDFEEIEEGEMKGNIIRNLREVKLWDTSDVNWGMNKATVANMKAYLPFVDTGTAPEDQKWEVPAAGQFSSIEFDDMDEEEKQRLFSHFAWTSNTPPQAFEDMKFPHHSPSIGGVGKAVWEGVESAMKALMQSDPGVPLPDRKAVYEHLAGHYVQFGKTAPEWDVIKLMWAIADGIKNLTAKEEVHSQLLKLDSILRAEPKSIPDRALLTQFDLFRELEFRKRILNLVS